MNTNAHESKRLDKDSRMVALVGILAFPFVLPWALYVFTPSGGINFDQFMYFPLQNYPASGYGGWLERIGDWAYVHE